MSLLQRFWVVALGVIPCSDRLLPKEITIIRNNKEAEEVFGEMHGGGEYQLECPSQAGGPQYIKFDSNSESWIRLP
jgi:hypothetical protein